MNKSHTIAEKYNILSERFVNKQCTLITTLEEYKKNEDKYKKVNIIASCGYKRSDVFIHDFFNKGCCI